MKLSPLGDRVLIELLKTKTTEVGGILLPDEAQEQPPYGIVRAVGPDVQDRELQPKTQVLFNKYAGLPVRLERTECLLVPESEIIAIIGG